MKNTLIISLFAVILLLLIYIGSCTHSGSSIPEVQYKDSITETHTTDTIKIQGKDIPYPVPYKTIDTFIISQNADTLKILAEYIKLSQYNLSISDDTNSKINVFVDVQYNRIAKWRPEATYYPHTTTINNTRTIELPKKNRLLAGLKLSGNKEYFGASPTLLLVTKKDNALSVGYDVINKNYELGYFVKLGKR